MPSVPTGTQPSGWATRGHESAASSGVTTAAGWSVAGTRGAPQLPPRVHGSSGSLSIVALAMSAFGPLHRRLAPPPGRQRTTRRQSRSLSGPLRAFRPPGGHPTRRCWADPTTATPRRMSIVRKVPVNAGSQRRRLGAGPPHRRPPGPAIGGTRVRSSGCCSDPTTAARRVPQAVPTLGIDRQAVTDTRRSVRPPASERSTVADEHPRRRSRHSDPSTAVSWHRRLAVSRTTRRQSWSLSGP